MASASRDSQQSLAIGVGSDAIPIEKGTLVDAPGCELGIGFFIDADDTGESS